MRTAKELLETVITLKNVCVLEFETKTRKAFLASPEYLLDMASRGKRKNAKFEYHYWNCTLDRRAVLEYKYTDRWGQKFYKMNIL